MCKQFRASKRYAFISVVNTSQEIGGNYNAIHECYDRPSDSMKIKKRTPCVNRDLIDIIRRRAYYKVRITKLSVQYQSKMSGF